jgi:hypothetical protein
MSLNRSRGAHLIRLLALARTQGGERAAWDQLPLIPQPLSPLRGKKGEAGGAPPAVQGFKRES